MAVLEVTARGGVARVVMDRPPLNVIDLQAAREMADVLDGVRRQDDLSVVLLSGRGKAFCAGVDVRDHLPDRGAEMLHQFHRLCRMLLEIECPVVAAVHGAALGGGCELTLVCDLVVASERATFGQPEIRLGVFPPVAAVALPRMVPAHVASELLLTGRIVNAEEALRIGLVNRVAPEAEFEEAVEGLVAELAALSPASLRLTKQAMRLARRRPSPKRIEQAEELYVEELMHSDDAVEGLKAFLEKRPPAWRRDLSGSPGAGT